jgi:hypothetical protein
MAPALRKARRVDRAAEWRRCGERKSEDMLVIGSD